MNTKVTAVELRRAPSGDRRNLSEPPERAPGVRLRTAPRYGRPGRRIARDSSSDPYWMLLPGWLDDLYSGSRRHHDPLLADTLRAQHRLFLAFRIRDDLMDDPATPGHLAATADRCIAEAESIFSAHFEPRSAFWRTYRSSIRNTTAAVIKLDRFQRSPYADLRTMLRLYSRVNAIFRVGSAAICTRYGRMSDFPALRAFSDRFSAGCQILDDLSDINEDFDRRRWNYAANYLLRRPLSANAGARNGIERISLGLLTGGGEALLDIAARLIDGAFRAIVPLGIPEASYCRQVYTGSIRRMERELSAVHPWMRPSGSGARNRPSGGAAS